MGDEGSDSFRGAPHAPFRIGSISKMFVSLSVLMLQEEGKLALDDVVRSRIPEVAFESYGLWLALRVPAGAGNGVARVHTLLVAGANVLAAAYLLYWGIIGLRSWM